MHFLLDLFIYGSVVLLVAGYVVVGVLILALILACAECGLRYLGK